MAFGRFVACVNSVLYWLSNPVWVGGLLAIEAFQATNDFFFHMALRVVLAVRVLARVHLVRHLGRDPLVRRRQVDPDAGRLVRGSSCSPSSPSRRSCTRSSTACTRPASRNFKPTYGGFILLVPVLFFNYVGFELPSAAGDEMEDAQKDVPFTVHPVDDRVDAALRRADPGDHPDRAGAAADRGERPQSTRSRSSTRSTAASSTRRRTARSRPRCPASAR